MPLSLPDYQRRSARIREVVVGQLSSIWNGLPDYRDRSIDKFVRVAVPKVQAGQIAAARVTAQYLGGTVDREAIVTARSVDQAVEYRRPAVTVYTELAAGAALTVAVESGGRRLTSIASTDIQLARTVQARSSLAGSRFTYYRRVLSGSENCAMCAIASTQRYHRKNLLPIHPGCDCGVEPVEADYDPGQVIDPDLLEQVHGLIADQGFGGERGARELGLGKLASNGKPVSDYTELIVTREHGEYGPTLAWRSDKFTGPGGLAA